MIKVAVYSRLQLLLQSEPLAYTNSGVRQTKFGDTFAGFQAVVIDGKESHPTLAVSYFHKIHEAGLPEVDFGSPSNSALILFSGDLIGFHFDADGLANELAEASRRRAQFGQTLSISHPLKRLTLSGEIWHFTQPLLNGMRLETSGQFHIRCGETSSSMEASITGLPAHPRNGRPSSASPTCFLTVFGELARFTCCPIEPRLQSTSRPLQFD